MIGLEIRKDLSTGANTYIVDSIAHSSTFGVLSRDDYYPFGGTFNSSATSPENLYKYNGKEEQQETGWLDYGARMYDPMIGRFFTQDRFSEKYLDMTPYQYGANNPIFFIDVNGDSLVVNEIDQGATQQFQGIVSNGSGGYYQAGVDANGLVTVTATGKKGKISKEQQNFVDGLNTVAGHDVAATTVNLVSESENVLIGDVTTSTIDVGDAQKLGTDGKITAQGAVLHEVVESSNVQNGSSNMSAHLRATGMEGFVNGIQTSPVRPYTQITNTAGVVSVPVTGPNSQRGTVQIHVNKNNIWMVTGNEIRQPLPIPTLRK